MVIFVSQARCTLVVLDACLASLIRNLPETIGESGEKRHRLCKEASSSLGVQTHVVPSRIWPEG